MIETTLQLFDHTMQNLNPTAYLLKDANGNVLTPSFSEDGKVSVLVHGKLFIEFTPVKNGGKNHSIELRVNSGQRKSEFTLIVDPLTGDFKAIEEKFVAEPKKNQQFKRFPAQSFPSLMVAPPNDVCGSAAAVVLGANAFTNVDATTTVGDPAMCQSVSKDVWFSYLATGTGFLTATTCAGAAPLSDTVLSIYSGLTCPPGAAVGCNDDACAPNLSSLTVPVTSGTSYLIRVASWSTSAAGAGTLTLSFSGPPSNDECAGATTVTCGSSTTQSNAAATSNVTDPIFSCHFGAPGPGFRSLWYKFVATGPNVTLSTDNSVLSDTLLGLYSGSCGALTEIACNDDISATNFQSSISYGSLVTGQTYYVQLSAFSSTATGSVTLDVTCPVGPPPGDACADAIAIPCNGSDSVDNTSFVTELSDPGYSCHFSGPGIQGFGTAWFTFVATHTSAVVSTNASVVVDTLLAVYDGTCGSFLEIACNDDISGTNLRSEVCVSGLTVGNTYYIQASGWSNADRGVIDVALTCPCPEPPANDECVDAEVVGALPAVINADLTNATADLAGAPCGLGTLPDTNIWYLVAGTGTTLRASTCTLNTVATDTMISVYCADCGDLVCVGGDDDLCTAIGGGTFKSIANWCSQAGANYLVTVGTFPGTIPDTIELTISDLGTSCTVAVGCLPTGGCCLPDATCVELTAGDCAAAGGTYQGDGSACTADLGLVADPSFEAAAPAGNSPNWTETSTVFGTPLCDLATCGGAFARTGAWWSWFGGTNSAEVGSVTQSVTIPVGNPTLEFWLAIPSGTAADDVRALIDGNVEFIALGNDAFYTGATYKLVSVPLAAYADGGVHTLRLDSTKTAGHGANFFVDDVTITGQAITCITCYDLDFETDDSGASMAHGTMVDTEYDGGANFPVTVTGVTPAILNSTTGPASQDPDLLVGTGNILINQNDSNLSQCGAGIYCTHNDDEDGGTLSFAFNNPTSPASIVLVDIDSADPGSSVVLTDGNGFTRTYTIPADWTGDLVSDGPPGFGTLDLTTLANQPGFGSTATAAEDVGFDGDNVVQIDVNLGGSGGVDDLSWCE